MPHAVQRGMDVFMLQATLGPHRVQQLAITWLLTLGTAALCVLVNHGPSVIDAVPPVV